MNCVFRDVAPEGDEGDFGRPVVSDEIVLHFERVYTVAEVAKKLSLSSDQVMKHINDHSLVAVNVGRGSERRDLRILDEDLEGFVRRRRTGAVPPEQRVVKTDRHQGNNTAYSGATFAERRAARLAGRK